MIKRFKKWLYRNHITVALHHDWLTAVRAHHRDRYRQLVASRAADVIEANREIQQLRARIKFLETNLVIARDDNFGSLTASVAIPAIMMRPDDKQMMKSLGQKLADQLADQLRYRQQEREAMQFQKQFNPYETPKNL